ncbi:Neurexophilin [Branchiostoma belcheri]|nr:Neurexophilin [Branchiostoma belcheri]
MVDVMDQKRQSDYMKLDRAGQTVACSAQNQEGTPWINNRMMKTHWSTEKSHSVPSYLNRWNHLVIKTENKRNNTISNTGDFFRGSIISAESKSGAVGIVTDHQNGNYTATFRLLWEGEVTIRIQLVLPQQTIDVIEKNRREDPFEMVTFQKRFVVGKRNVDTQCNVDPAIFKDSPVCDYSDLHAGVRW